MDWSRHHRSTSMWLPQSKSPGSMSICLPSSLPPRTRYWLQRLAPPPLVQRTPENKRGKRLPPGFQRLTKNFSFFPITTESNEGNAARRRHKFSVDMRSLIEDKKFRLVDARTVRGRSF